SGSRKPRPRRNGETPQKGLGVHRRSAGTLQARQAERAFSTGHRQPVIEHLARLSCPLRKLRGKKLQALSLELEPGARPRREGAHATLQFLRGPTPIKTPFLAPQLLRIGGPFFGLRPRMEFALCQ